MSQKLFEVRRLTDGEAEVEEFQMASGRRGHPTRREAVLSALWSAEGDVMRAAEVLAQRVQALQAMKRLKEREEL
jgi:hypothetical protein